MNHRGVGCEVDKDDFMSIEDEQWITDGVVDFHNVREMRRDLCAHAGGELLKQLQELGIEVPPQDEGLVTAQGTVVQVRNTAEGDGRQAPNTRHDEDARFTEMTRRIASLHNDVRYLDASFTVIANFVGLSRDEVVSAATQLLLHGGVAGTARKQRRVATSMRHAHPSVRLPGRGEMTAVLRRTQRGKRKQQRLGGYTTEEEAAFAYAAGAFVLRPSERIPNTVSLSAAEKATLRGAPKKITDPGGSEEVVEVEELA
ncbi:unnamed protein product [Closterium sp. NIES-64]|nr:unnamed protein product [Closterium sp. NIES-64]